VRGSLRRPESQPPALFFRDRNRDRAATGCPLGRERFAETFRAYGRVRAPLWNQSVGRPFVPDSALDARPCSSSWVNVPPVIDVSFFPARHASAPPVRGGGYIQEAVSHQSAGFVFSGHRPQPGGVGTRCGTERSGFVFSSPVTNTNAERVIISKFRLLLGDYAPGTLDHSRPAVAEHEDLCSFL
jgi:hypothetical protein